MSCWFPNVAISLYQMVTETNRCFIAFTRKLSRAIKSYETIVMYSPKESSFSEPGVYPFPHTDDIRKEGFVKIWNCQKLKMKFLHKRIIKKFHLISNSSRKSKIILWRRCRLWKSIKSVCREAVISYAFLAPVLFFFMHLCRGSDGDGLQYKFLLPQ